MILETLIRQSARRRMRQVDIWRRSPVPVQEEMLLRLVRMARETRFGREHGFDRIRSVRDYQERVPIRSYGDFEPYWGPLLDGARDMTWPGRIRDFALSSGTTVGRKYVPFPACGRRDYFRVSRDVIHFYISLTGDTSVLTGKSLFLAGAPRFEKLRGGCWAGDISGYMMAALPWPLSSRRVLGSKLCRLTDWEKKLDMIVAASLRADVRRVTGSPSWLLCVADRIFQAKRRNGERADTLADVWPNLGLYAHSGVNFEPYRDAITELCGGRIQTLNVYAASEGLFGIQDQLNTPELLLIADGGWFYEFVPVGELGLAQPARHTVGDVEKEVEYAIIVTSNCGLWSYVVGDTVRFTSLRPHRFVVVGRTDGVLNAFGEHVGEEEVTLAIADACKETKAQVLDYHVAPRYPKAAHRDFGLQCFVEFQSPPVDMGRFEQAMDASLCRQNISYEEHRQMAPEMRSLQMVPLPKGTFFESLKRTGRLGSQAKVPRLSDERAYADLLTRLATERVPVSAES